MSVTIHYRGTMDDLNQVESMEDRMLDLAFSLGGRATIWRSYANHDRTRIIRGLMIEIEPGQEKFSLLISPEGHLTPLIQVQEAEEAAFDEPPWCSVKTQFGTPLGHVAIVLLLDAIRQQYCSDLVVSDEAEYYTTRDFNLLQQKLCYLNSAIDVLADGLRAYSLSKEATEDPDILAIRIQRIAALVQQKLSEAMQDPSKQDQDDTQDVWREPTLEEEVDTFDRMRRQSDLRSERMKRRIAEATADGMSIEEAFDLAMQEAGLPIPDSKSNEFEVETNAESDDSSLLIQDQQWEQHDSQHEHTVENHPAVVRAQDFLYEVMDLAKDRSIQSDFMQNLQRAALEIVGGLVQATCGEMDDVYDQALSISQLKRALFGHGFARGAVIGLHGEGTISLSQSRVFHEQLKSILDNIQALAEQAWADE